MAETLQFELVSPERLLVSEPVEMVVVPGAEGDFGALPHHAPMIATVRPGVIDIYADGQVRTRIFVAGGFVEVTETHCTVLAEEAVAVADLNGDAIAKRLKDAEEDLEDASNDAQRAVAERSIFIARAMLAVIAAGHKAH